MRPLFITVLPLLLIALGGCNKATPVEATPSVPTATISSAPSAALPASAPASDPSVPAASNVVSSPGSSASAP